MNSVNIVDVASQEMKLKEDLEDARLKLKIIQERTDLYDKEIMTELKIFGTEFKTPLEGVKYLKDAYLGLKCKIKEEEEAETYANVAKLDELPSNPIENESQESDTNDGKKSCFSKTEELDQALVDILLRNKLRFNALILPCVNFGNIRSPRLEFFDGNIKIFYGNNLGGGPYFRMTAMDDKAKVGKDSESKNEHYKEIIDDIAEPFPFFDKYIIISNLQAKHKENFEKVFEGLKSQNTGIINIKCLIFDQTTIFGNDDEMTKWIFQKIHDLFYETLQKVIILVPNTEEVKADNLMDMYDIMDEITGNQTKITSFAVYDPYSLAFCVYDERKYPGEEFDETSFPYTISSSCDYGKVDAGVTGRDKKGKRRMWVRLDCSFS